MVVLGSFDEETKDETLKESERVNQLQKDTSMIFVFKEYLVEVWHIKDERGDITKSFISIHHLEENITVFWYPPAKG